MTIVYTSELFSEHDNGNHPESSLRNGVLWNHLKKDAQLRRGEVPKILSSLSEGEPQETRYLFDALAKVHSKEMIKGVEQICLAGGGQIDADTRVSRRSFDVALSAVASALKGVDDVVNGLAKNALCLVRPPGHHATFDQSMGFCLFNQIAVAARYAQSHHGLDKILIVDWDVHHGNGTQDIFYEDPSVGFFSIHRYPFYPGSGASDETGAGKGRGTTFNVPVAYGTSRKDYLEAFRRHVTLAAVQMKPDLILLSAGFDAHKADPVGNLGLETEDFGTMTEFLMDLAEHHCGGRLVSCLEGGYDLEALTESVALHLRHLQERRIQKNLGF